MFVVECFLPLCES